MVQYEWFLKSSSRALIGIPSRVGIRPIFGAPSSSVTGRDLNVPYYTRTTPIPRLFRIT
jgi:hypothetical protein